MEDSPPEEGKDNKLVERLQPYKDEAGNPNRIAQVNQRYKQSIGLIKEFTEQFGLIDPSTNECKVPLNQVVQKEDWENWKQKDAVKDSVSAIVKGIVEFKQQLFQDERQKIFDKLDREEKLKAEQEEARKLRESYVES